MKKRDLKAKLPLKALQIGCGAFGVHLKKHLEKRLDNLVVTTDRNLRDQNFSDYDFIFLATNDSSLQDLVSKLSHLKAKLVHFSGFHYFESTLGLHPVASFNKESDYNLEQITFVADGEMKSDLTSVFPVTERVAPNKKRLYHTFLSVAANSMQLLSYNLGKDFEDITKLDKNLLKKIVIQSLQVEQSVGEQSFSGPWVRGEKELQDETVSAIPSDSVQNLNEVFKKEISIYLKNSNQKKEV